ncbi:MAG TPA: isocitrate dehydrogenase kinase/phosphatase AceK regulatory subunit [Isosphaeraceae bacterium]
MSPPDIPDRGPGGAGADAICVAFADYERQFRAITRRAPARFERRDWHGMQHDAVERLELHGGAIAAIVAEIRFRDLPAARDDQDELCAEPCFSVGANDVFPEEFLTFMGLADPLRAAFLRAHADLLTVRCWRDARARHRAGDVMDITPYGPGRRLRTMDPIPYRPSRRYGPG